MVKKKYIQDFIAYFPPSKINFILCRRCTYNTLQLQTLTQQCCPLLAVGIFTSLKI